MKPTRQQALRAGIARYFGGACSLHVHLEGERYVSGSCVACAAEKLQRARKEHPERTKAHATKSNHRVANTPELRAQKRLQDAKYRAANKASVAATIKHWRDANRDLVNAYVKKSKAKNPALVLASTVKRRLAKLHRTPAWLTADEHWMMEQTYELAALRTKLFGFQWHVDHIIPLQGKLVSGFHTPYNLQVIPGVENVRKLNAFEVTA